MEIGATTRTPTLLSKVGVRVVTAFPGRVRKRQFLRLEVIDLEQAVAAVGVKRKQRLPRFAIHRGDARQPGFKHLRVLFEPGFGGHIGFGCRLHHGDQACFANSVFGAGAG